MNLPQCASQTQQWLYLSTGLQIRSGVTPGSTGIHDNLEDESLAQK